MTKIELIKELEKFDDDTEIQFYHVDSDEWLNLSTLEIPVQENTVYFNLENQ